MDHVLRNRSPENSYDAKILRDRRADDRRADLARHQREEDLLRLNNSWYSKQSSSYRELSPSPHSQPSLSTRPYGVINDIKLVSPQRRSISQSPPTQVRRESERQSLSPSIATTKAGNEYSANYRNGFEIPHSSNQEAVLNMPAASMQSPVAHKAVPGPPMSNAFTATKSPTAEQEYAVASRGFDQQTLARAKLRKVRELSGTQVAQLLGDRPGFRSIASDEGSLRASTSRPSPIFAGKNNLSHVTTPTVAPEVVAKELLEQIRRREEEEKRQRQMEMQMELDRVRSTLTDAKARLEEEDEARYAKQQEALRLLQDSERNLREAAARKKQLEAAEENLVRLEREALEARRQQETARRRALVDDRLAKATSLANDPYRFLDLLPMDSPLKEATKRLLDAHIHDLDVVGPIVHEILNEPEFAFSTW